MSYTKEYKERVGNAIIEKINENDGVSCEITMNCDGRVFIINRLIDLSGKRVNMFKITDRASMRMVLEAGNIERTARFICNYAEHHKNDKLTLEYIIENTLWVVKMQGWRTSGTWEQIKRYANDEDCRDCDISAKQPTKKLQEFWDAHSEYIRAHEFITAQEFYPIYAGKEA